MIILFLIDLLVWTLFGIPSYLIIAYLPYLKKTNIFNYFFLISYISLYFLGFNLINIIIIFIIYLIDLLLKKHLKKSIIFINYVLYYLILNIIYPSINIILFFKLLFISFVESIIIYHLFNKLNIKLSG